MSRTNARSRRLRRRSSRVVPATIVAAVLTAAGVLTVIAVINQLINGSWPSSVTSPASSVAALTWGSTIMIVVTVVVVLLGLVLLIAGLKPGGFRSAQLAGPSGAEADRTDFVMSNGAIARLAAGQADTIDGVDKVSASADGRRVHLRLTTSSEQTTEIRDRAVRAVTDTLTAAGLQPAPRVSASIRTKEL